MKEEDEVQVPASGASRDPHLNVDSHAFSLVPGADGLLATQLSRLGRLGRFPKADNCQRAGYVGQGGYAGGLVYWFWAIEQTI